MTNGDTLWQRDGRNIEDLPDPFTPPVFNPVSEDEIRKPLQSPRRRRWRYFFYAIFAL